VNEKDSEAVSVGSNLCFGTKASGLGKSR